MDALRNPFLLSTHEKWIVLVSLENFHVWGLFIPKKRVKSVKKNPSVTCRCRPYREFLNKIWGAASSAVLGARKLKFWLPASFEPTWCTSYQNFEILLKTQELKNFEISFESFQKMLDG
jgi:hypothetical protein